MKDVLTCNGYYGSVHYNGADEVFYGKIEGIDDLVTFEGSSVEELKKAFEEAVDDYIVLCKKKKKESARSYKGSFNIRMPSELHREISRSAALSGLSLNQFIRKAVEEKLQKDGASG